MPCLRVFYEQAPEHLELVGDPCFHDGVVNVADHNVAAALGGNEDRALGLYRRVILEPEVHRMPDGAGGGNVLGLEMDAKVAVLVGGDPFLRAVELRDDPHSGYRASHDPPLHLAQLISKAVLVGWGDRLGLSEDAADQEDLSSGPVAPGWP
jgi:hypothetical protein